MSHFKDQGVPHTNLTRLASVILCLPGSNAPVERVFSLMNNLWTAEKNRFALSTVNAILTVKMNFRATCLEFMDRLSKKINVLKKIHSSEKYNR